MNRKSFKYTQRKRIAQEDFRILQSKITGMSVYRGIRTAYRRRPKHKAVYPV
jgi:hypothetical protein